MPNLPIERVHEITRVLNEIIRHPGNTGNQGKLDEIAIEFFFLEPDEKTKELYDRAKAAIEAALAAARGPDWGSVTAPPTQEFPEIRF
jgi:hypothetical protein